MSISETQLVLQTDGGNAGAAHAFVSLSRAARRKPLAAIAVLMLVAIIALVVVGPMVARYTALQSDSDAILSPPSASHWLGTDQYGRDLFARMTVGGRISLTVGLGAVAISALLGTALGLASGYLGGRADFLIQRFVDLELSVPTLLLLLIASGIAGQSIAMLVLSIGILTAIRSSRVIRAAALGVKVLPFVEAERALGGGHVRIVLRHILPNVMAPVLVLASVGIGQAVIFESTLSFLGYGVPPPNPSWGSMLGGSSRPFLLQAPWLPIAPGVALAATVYAFNMFGDGLRDLLDPRLRSR